MPSRASHQLIETAQSLEEDWTAASFAAAQSVGIAIDDPDDPHAAVAVHDGRIVYMGISDPLLTIGLDQLTDLLNALILTAFSQWRAQLSAIASYGN